MVTEMAAVGFQNGIMANGVFRAAIAFVLCSFAVLAGISVPAPAGAANGFGITGSFSSQSFEIPQGSSVSGPSIDIIIYNNTAEAFNVQMTAMAASSDNVPEPGINVNLSQHDFVLAAGADLKILIGVVVGAEVAPGQYKLSVTANRVVTPGGPVVGLAVGEDAWLTVTGYSASVSVNTVGTSGQPVVSIVRLWRLTDAEIRNEVAYSNTGSLQALVAPGRYVASAYSISTGDLLKEQESVVVAGDEKTITLTVDTVSFESFAVNEFRNNQTGELGWAQVVYSVLNNYKPLDNARIGLVVNRNGALLEEVAIWGPLTLPTGRTGAPYNYIPSDGRWRGGLYTFKLQLYVNDQLWAGTNEATLDVGGGGAKSSPWIIFVILGILGAAGLGFLIFFLLKRRQKGEKPEKAEKKERRKKEEKPAPKAAEPVRKPEPYRAPEPIRPVQPVRYEEPTVEPTAEPATLSTVSTLKARMASMGRDEGTGKPAEEEPDTEKKGEPFETGPLASQPAPVPPPPKIEPERPAVKKVEEKGHKPGIFSKVTATGKKEPPKPPVAQGPAPVKPGDEVTINWPPKTVEPPKPPSDVQINWPPKPVEPPEPPEPSALEEAARQRVEAQQHVVAPEEAAPEEEVPSEDPSEPVRPPSRSSFSEAARLRMEARLRASEKGKTGAGPGESQTDGGSGEGGDHSPSP